MQDPVLALWVGNFIAAVGLVVKMKNPNKEKNNPNKSSQGCSSKLDE